MITRDTPEGILAISPAAHGWVTGQIARAWGDPGFGDVEPWEEVCLAAEQHESRLDQLESVSRYAALICALCSGEAERPGRLTAELSGLARYSAALGGALLDRNRDLLGAWDRMAMALCLDQLPYSVADVPTAEGQTALTMAGSDGGAGIVIVSPWPFRWELVHLVAEAHLLADGDAPVDAGRPTTLIWTLRPA